MHRAWFRAIIATLLVSVAAPAAAADQILLGSAFLAKDPMRALLERVPVKVILNPEAGLLGAAVHAQHMLASA